MRLSLPTRFSIALAIVVPALLAVLVVGLMAQLEANTAAERRVRLATAIEQVRYYDELLTMSARLADSTGDLTYVERYERAAPQLDAVLAQANELVPDERARAAVAQTAEANAALIALETASFDKLRAEDRTGAYALVSGPLYESLKAQYWAGMDTALDRMTSVAEDQAGRAYQRQVFSAAIGALAVVVLVVLWFSTVIQLRRSHTARSQVEEQLRQQALSDALTGLANRRSLRTYLNAEVARHRTGPSNRGPKPPQDTTVQSMRERTTGQTLAVIFIDLDGFKVVNDVLGHARGDELLGEVAERLQALLADHVQQASGPTAQEVGHGETAALAARLGGDEFALVVACRDVVQAGELTGRLLERLARPYRAAGSTAVSASIGMSVFPADTPELSELPRDPAGQETADDRAIAAELLRQADLAMYSAKSGGRGRWASYRPEMQASAAERLRVETELRAGIAGGQIVVLYQPIIDLVDGHLDGVEALVRWNHPVQGLLGPQHFLAVAEESDLIVDLGWQVLEQACTQMSTWWDTAPERAPEHLAVNVDVRQLLVPSFADNIAQVLIRTGLPAHRLILEVTESAVMSDVQTSSAMLTQLRATGCRTAIDDFGTGHSSLARLQQMDIDILKVDQSFVRGAEHDATMLEVIIALGQRLGMQVVIEGIETAEELALVRALGGRTGQGYLFARPAPAGELLAAQERARRMLSPVVQPLDA